jgi:hypothetical protein
MNGLSALLRNNQANPSMATLNQPAQNVSLQNIGIGGLNSLGSYSLSGRRRNSANTLAGDNTGSANNLAQASVNPAQQAAETTLPVTNPVTATPTQQVAATATTTPVGGLAAATLPVATQAAVTPTIPTQAQLDTIVKAKVQGRDLPLGEVQRIEGFYVYRDPSTGVLMKTKDKAAADYSVAQSNLALTTAGTTDAEGNTILANDPNVRDWTQLATLPADIDYNAFTYNDINDYMTSVGSGIVNVTKPGSYNSLLSSMYGPSGNLISGGSNPAFIINGGNQQNINQYGGYTPFTYSDPAKADAVKSLERALRSTLYTSNFGGTTTLNTRKIDPDISPFLKGKDAVGVGRTGISMLDALNDADKAKLLQKISDVKTLHKKYKIRCRLNKKFCRWVPISVVGENTEIIQDVQVKQHESRYASYLRRGGGGGGR